MDSFCYLCFYTLSCLFLAVLLSPAGIGLHSLLSCVLRFFGFCLFPICFVLFVVYVLLWFFKIRKKITKFVKIASQHKQVTSNNWASTREYLFSGFANNKGTNQHAHPPRLISVFVILVLESVISISNFLASLCI